MTPMTVGVRLPSLVAVAALLLSLWSASGWEWCLGSVALCLFLPLGTAELGDVPDLPAVVATPCLPALFLPGDKSDLSPGGSSLGVVLGDVLTLNLLGSMLNREDLVVQADLLPCDTEVSLDGVILTRKDPRDDLIHMVVVDVCIRASELGPDLCDLVEELVHVEPAIGLRVHQVVELVSQHVHPRRSLGGVSLQKSLPRLGSAELGAGFDVNELAIRFSLAILHEQVEDDRLCAVEVPVLLDLVTFPLKELCYPPVGQPAQELLLVLVPVLDLSAERDGRHLVEVVLVQVDSDLLRLVPPCRLPLSV